MKIKVWLSIGFAQDRTAVLDIDDEEIRDCIDNGGSEEDALLEALDEWVRNYLDSGYEKLEDNT